MNTRKNEVSTFPWPRIIYSFQTKRNKQTKRVRWKHFVQFAFLQMNLRIYFQGWTFGLINRYF